MVARAFKRDFCDDKPAQGVGEEFAGRVKNGRMVKPGGPGPGRRSAPALPGIEAEVMMIAAGRYKGRTWPACGERKSQYPAVEIERLLQIGNLQVDMADPHPGVDRGELKSLFLKGYGLAHR